MANYLEAKRRMQELYKGSSTSTLPEREEDFYIDKNATLKKDDLLKYEYLTPIRSYMIERKGVDYQDKSAEEVVDDFVQHMRYFNANSVSTTGELRFINKASQRTKDTAGKAYQIYEQLGNVFQNDGAMGAVDGVKDYIFAAAKDPTNYLGLVTGGLGRFLAGGYSLAGKKVIQDAVKRAGLQAARDGKSASQIRKAAEKAAMQAARKAARSGLSKNQSKKAAEKVTQEVTKEGRRNVIQNAMQRKQAELFDKASGTALKATLVGDAGFAMLQDSLAQNTLMEAGAQEQYSKTQTAFSSLLGGVAGAAQLGFGKFRGVSELQEPESTLGDIAKTVIENNSAILSRKDGKKVTKQMLADIEAWNEKVDKGLKLEAAVMPSDLFSTIMLGTDGKGGLARLMHDRGMKIHSKKLTADVVTNVVRFLPEEDLIQINKAMGKYTNLTLGEIGDTKGIDLTNLLSKDSSEAGKILNVLSQTKNIVNSGIVAAGDKAKKTLEDDIAEATEEVDKMNKSQPLKYGQSVWKRLLVSSPATTMINVAGFAQYYVGQTMADLFNFGLLSFKALAQSTYDTNAARTTMRQARAYTQVQAQKFRNLLDPYTTHDAYMRFLNDANNEQVRKKLFETMSGGVEVNAERFGIDPNNKLYRNIEAGANAAANISGVRIQDSFTKSQMFMTEMDKYMRINKGKSLKEAMIAGDEPELEVIQGALDGTLKSVFSKDYTTTEQPELLRTAAKMAETFSNTPGFGTLLPFGRFFNNVVATAYQWSFLSTPEQFFRFGRTMFKQNPEATEMDAFARYLVGNTALMMSMQYDNERREQGLGVYEVDVGGGTIVDAKNTYPFSLWLAGGRVLNTMRNGEQVSADLQREIGTQLAVGQLARDAQFANDINNILDVLTNVDIDKRAAAIDGLYKVTGNFAAGFTRPVDVVNKAVGMALGNDTAKDVRQAEGINAFSQTATKYVDNIIEALFGKIDSITGEELEVATREGEIYDPNPFARMFGLTIKPGRTATEKVYSMADMADWKASERTNIPAYDKIFNGMLAPMLETYTQELLDNPRFKEASIKQKRGMLKKRMSDVKARVRESMEGGYAGYDARVLNNAVKATRKFNKETRREALKMLKRDYGITGQLEDLNFRELELFMRYAEFIKEAEDAVGRI
jgi:hypothetical protein